MVINHLCSYTKTCDPRYIVCTGTHPILLSATKDLGLYLRFLVDIQKTNPLGSVQLMTAYRQQINPCLFRMDGIFSKCLDSIHMVQSLRAFLMDKCSDLFHRHHCTHFIIHIHGRNKDRIRTKCFFQGFHIYHTCTIYRKDCNFIAHLRQPFHWLPYCCMLHCCSDHVFSTSCISLGCPKQGKIIAFCPTGCKKDLFFLYFQDPCKDLLCIADVFFCFHTLLMHG